MRGRGRRWSTIAIGALAAACGRGHDGARLEVRQADCVVCHRADYQAVTQPPHAGVFPESCGECHSTMAWHPALGLHPEDAFPIRSGPHVVVTCADCHDATRGAYAEGANTSCVGCHTGEHARARVDDQHRGIPDYAFDAATPSFCLSCHPKGLAEGKHPEDRFPIRGGPHQFACLDCHEPERGSYVAGENTDCVGCHTGEHSRARVDAEHREEPGYVFDPDRPSFCLRCHPSGRTD
jgi:hypothetical protein